MPLGLAKAVLGQPTVAAAAASGYAAYRQTNAISTGNLAGHTITGLDWARDNDVSFVFWFRALNADNDGDSDDWIQGTSGGSSGSVFFNVPHSAGNGLLRLRYTMQDFGWQMSTQSSESNGANAYVDSRGQGPINNDGGSPSTVAAATFDGEWKCLMMSFQSDHNTGGLVSGTNENTAHQFRNCYVGDSDLTSAPGGHNAGPILLNTSGTGDYDEGMLGYGGSSFTTTVPTSSGSGLVGPGFHWGPMWVYNSFIDFDSQSERRKFFNPSETDGFVSPSNTGTTSAGAAQPLLYLYWNGSALVNGGSDSISIAKRTVGTGGGFTSITDGPGSGGTI